MLPGRVNPSAIVGSEPTEGVVLATSEPEEFFVVMIGDSPVDDAALQAASEVTTAMTSTPLPSRSLLKVFCTRAVLHRQRPVAMSAAPRLLPNGRGG